MKQFRIQVPLTKVDLEQRLVYGVAAVEQLDKANEIFDYATSKPLFEKWSSEIEKASGGKSLGNVRAMHGKVAAGKLTQISFNDEAKQVEVCSKCVDDNEWQKICEGVYTGYSIGGSYSKKWDDPLLKGAKRYTGEPTEISYVDNPCAPGATFQAVKSDGAVELRKFAEHKPTLPKLDMAKLADSLGSGLKKGMYDVADMASILSSLACIQRCLEYEADYEGDGSQVPADLREALINLIPIFVRMAEEEASELLPEKADVIKSAQTQINKEVAETTMELSKLLKVVTDATDLEALRKDVPAHLAEIGKHVDKIAKAHKSMGDSLSVLQGGEKEAKEDEPAEKLAKADLAKADLAKRDERLTVIEASLAEQNGALKNITEALTKFMSRAVDSPVAINGAGVVVQKEQDGLNKAAPVEDKDPRNAMKKIHAGGPSGHLFGYARPWRISS